MASLERRMNNANWIATVGVGLLLFAFFFNIIGSLKSTDKFYSFLNLAGGVLSAYASWLADFYPFVVLNIIWSITTLVFLIKPSVPRETK